MTAVWNDSLAYIKRNVWKVTLAILAMVAAYGFYVSTYTLNVDDVFTEFYDGGRLVAAGRFTGFVMQMLVGCMTYSPFFTMFVALCILFVAGLLYTRVLHKASDGKLSDNALFVFWIVFLTYPIISEQMVYPVIHLLALGYAFVAVSLYLMDRFLCEKSWGSLALAAVLMVLTIDFYEAFAAVYLTLLMAVVFTKFMYADDRQSVTFKKLFFYIVQSVIFLVAVIVIRMVIAKLVMFAFYGTFQSGYSGNAGVYWLEIGIVDCAIWLMRTLFLYYGFAAADYFAVFVYVMAVVIGTVLAIVMSVKKKSIIPVLAYVFMIAASLSLSILLGLAAYYTMAQALVILVAYTALMLYTAAEHKKISRVVVSVLLVLLVLNQAKSLNTWSVINYERYDYEMAVVDHIGQDLVSEYDVASKPVVFIGAEDAPYLPEALIQTRESGHPLVKKAQQLVVSAVDAVLPTSYFERTADFYGEEWHNASDMFEYVKHMRNRSSSDFSYLSWAAKESSWFDAYEKEDYMWPIYALFESRGYVLTRATEEDYASVIDMHTEYPAYPKTGYIIETDQYIVVNFGK